MTGAGVILETRANGKLLLSGEYAVLDGALALAVPVRRGQLLLVCASAEKTGLLNWTALDETGTPWFSAKFRLPGLEVMESAEPAVAQVLLDLLRACRRQNPAFLSEKTGLEVTTRLDFPRAWGLGSSSTLVAALARWSGADAFRLLSETLGGSGYDLACAYAGGPVLYRLTAGNPAITAVDYRPPFSERLSFVYLGKKQNTGEGIERYRRLNAGKTGLVEAVSELTEKWLQCATLQELEACIGAHENLIAQALDLPKVKDLFFPDYWGAVKSLGAWGGDFVLVTSEREEAYTRNYFSEKGFGTFFSWQDFVLQHTVF